MNAIEWLNFLDKLSILISVGVDAIVLCHVFPAFRRTRNRAFLLIAIACVLSILELLSDRTISVKGRSTPALILFGTLRQLSYFANCIVWCIGIVLLARPYLANYQGTFPESDRRDSPPDLP